MNKLKQWAIHLCLIGGSIVTAIGLSELGLRMAKMPAYQAVSQDTAWTPSVFHTFDPDLGWVLKPNASGWWKTEGEAYIEINSEGLRDHERSKAKPQNTIRIAVLGDSFTEAFQVPLEQTFLAEIERQLQTCSSLKSQNIDVINFGVQGYSTAQELMILRKKVWDYQPDWVILAFYTGNDMINNSPQLEYDRYRPFFQQKDGKLVEDYSFRQLSYFERNPYAVSKVDQWLGKVGEGSRILYLVKKIELDAKKRKLGKDFVKLRGKSFKEPQNQVWKNTWKITEDILTVMADEVQQKGAKFLVVTLTDPKQVDYDPESRQAFMDKHGIDNLFYPDERITALGKQKDFPVLNLVEPFQTYAEKHQICLHGFDNAVPCGGHWNVKGHQLAGEKIAEQLCEGVRNNG